MSAPVPVLNAPQPNSDTVLQQTCAQMEQERMMAMLCEGEEEEEDANG